MHARYESAEKVLLPYVAGSVLAWGRVAHHAERSYFRAEKALPIAFVRPRGGTGLFTGEAEEKLLHIRASGSQDLGELRGVALPYRRRGESLVNLRILSPLSGGEEKPEREEVVEPLVEPTPERRRERREETAPQPEELTQKAPTKAPV